MKSIKFSDSELEFLQTHYELELADAENYVEEIKNILKKLGAKNQVAPKEKTVKKEGKKPGRPRKEKKAEVVAVAEVPAKSVPTPAIKMKEDEPKKPKNILPKKGKKTSKKSSVKKPAAVKKPTTPAVTLPASS